MPPTARRRAATPWLIVAIGCAAVCFDGYDIILFGSIVPRLLAYKEWGLDPASVGLLQSYALFGMLFGAFLCGPLADRFGRRNVFVVSLAWYSTFALLTAFAPSPGIFGLLRFLAGIGFGGVGPVVVALTLEVAPPRLRNLASTIVLCGLPVGGIAAALISLAIGDLIGFRGLLALGGLALITVLPAAWVFVPSDASRAERVDRLGQKGRVVSAPQAGGRVRGLSGGLIVDLGLFSVLMFAGFLLVFGLNTWLPELMRRSGYGLGSALSFQVLLNVGAVCGGLLGSLIADRRSPRVATLAAFTLAAVMVALLVAAPRGALLYLVLFAGGAGALGAQMMVYNFAALHFPAGVRGTTTGIASGFGRLGAMSGPLVGGFLLSAGFSPAACFWVFAGVGLVGAVFCLLVPRPSADDQSSDDGIGSARADATRSVAAPGPAPLAGV